MSTNQTRHQWLATGAGCVDEPIGCYGTEQEAEQALREWLADGDYHAERTLRVHGTARCPDTGDDVAVVVEVQPPEPDCAPRQAHDWVVVSVSGNGAGVLICERCRCGVEKWTDTWGQDPTDGSQGHRIISYTVADNELEDGGTNP